MTVTVTEQPGTTEGAPERRPDPTGRMETAAEREARLLADMTPIDMKKLAKIVGRSHARIRELRMERLEAERVLEDPNSTEAEREDAEEYLLDAIPPQRDKINTSPWWYASDGYRWGRLTRRLDPVWYEPQELAAPGRPPGGRPKATHRDRMTFAEQLARLADVDVDQVDAQRLTPLVTAACASIRADGVRAGTARAQAIAQVAADTDTPAAVVEKILLEAIIARRNDGRDLP